MKKPNSDSHWFVIETDRFGRTTTFARMIDFGKDMDQVDAMILSSELNQNQPGNIPVDIFREAFGKYRIEATFIHDHRRGYANEFERDEKIATGLGEPEH